MAGTDTLIAAEPAWPQCVVEGLPLAVTDARGLLDHMMAALARGRGGWVVTANLDFVCRYAREPACRALYDAADIKVADGMPLVWAARLQGERRLVRIAGSSLVLDLAARLASEGRSLFLLGGAGDSARRAAAVLRTRWPTLVVDSDPGGVVSLHPRPSEVDAIAARVEGAAPGVLLVGLGSPKQEQVIQALRLRFPRTWMMGVGISFSFLAGDVARAPLWMQRMGLEWLHRLGQEPRRLARRYLYDDLPFAVGMLARAWRRRPDGIIRLASRR
jgi:N-acetylglucosaminyldiphosphoundecaprenol N-acetyl-beta-D-mannosaminyltransferase